MRISSLTLTLTLCACAPKAPDTGPVIDSHGGNLGCDYVPNVNVYGSVTYEDGGLVEDGVVTLREGDEEEATTFIGGGSYEVNVGERFEEPITLEVTAVDEAERCATDAPTVLVAEPCSGHQLDLVLTQCVD